jgi:TRAP transporter TAXI family solute receptor
LLRPVLIVAIPLALLLLLYLNSGPSTTSTENSGLLLGAETAAPGGPVYIATVALQKVTAKYTNHDIEINSSGVGPHSMVNLARGDIQIATVVPRFLTEMYGGTGRYSNLENAKSIANNIRLIASYKSGVYHFVTYDDSGIRTLEDLKGKTIFAGPLRGGSATSAKLLIESGTGYQEGRDYTMVDLDMRGGDAAFMDGHIDVLIRTPAIGAAMIEQLGITRNIRLISLNDKSIAALKTSSLQVGRFVTEIGPGVYTGQTNETPVKSLGMIQQLGVHKDVPASAVFDITQAMWTHIDEFRAVSPSVLSEVTTSNAFLGMTGPLHLGAYQYYRKQGFTIPENLIPPELDQQ